MGQAAGGPLCRDNQYSTSAPTSSILLTRVDDPLGIVDRLIATPGEEANQRQAPGHPPAGRASRTDARSKRLSRTSSAIFCRLSSRRLSIILVGCDCRDPVGHVHLPQPVRADAPSATRRSDQRGSGSGTQSARRSRQADGKQRKRTSAATSNYGPPLMQRMSTIHAGLRHV